MADYISQFTGPEIDQRLAKVTQLETNKQDKLVSGQNIKTVGGQSILGSGDIPTQDSYRPYNPQDPDGMGYRVLDKENTFASQVTATNTIYEIRYDYVVENLVTIPSGCELRFNGGSVSGGEIVLNNALLSGDVRIFSDIQAGSPSRNNEVFVDWFGASGNGLTDDSEHLLNAINALKYDGATLVFGMGKTYLHGDGLAGENGTGNSYTPQQNNPARPDTSLSANIGRDITLRFLGYDSLSIIGNGASIVSNENNGICKHNAIFFFGACKNVHISNLTINARNKARYVHSGVNISDYSTGNFGDYTGDIYDNWRNHVWVDSEAKGFAIRGNMYFYSCENVNLQGVESLESEMDGFYMSSLSGHKSKCFVFTNCVSKYSLRLGLGFNIVSEVFINQCEFSYAGKFNDESVIGASSNNAGLSCELETEPATELDQINGVIISQSRFVGNYEVGARFSTGCRRNTIDSCEFIDNGATFGVLSNLSLQKLWRFSEDNAIRNCTFYNGAIGINQFGSTVENNKFTFDKNYAGSTSVSMSLPSITVEGEPVDFYKKTIQILRNRFETDLTGADNTFSNYVNISGPLIVRDNYFKNICRPGTSNGIIINGLEVCNNTVEKDNELASEKVSFTITNTNYANQYNRKICADNRVIGFSCSSVNTEYFSFGPNKITRVLPAGSFTGTKWYQLPKSSGLITVVSQNSNLYRIHLEYAYRATGRFVIAYYESDYLGTYGLPAKVYYKGDVAYLYISSSALTYSVVYEQYVRYSDIKVDADYSIPVLDAAPDVSTFYEMVNLCLNTDIDYTAIPTYLAGKSIFKDGKPHWWSGTAWVDADGFTSNIARSGATADRPSASTVGAGFTYFDTDLGKMIVSNGTAWVNMDGTALS